MPFYFFCLVIGIIVGAILTWFLLADHPFESREAPGGPVDEVEAGLLASQLATAGTRVDEETVARVLELHGAYVVGRIHDEEARGEPVDGDKTDGDETDGGTTTAAPAKPVEAGGESGS
jgi:hypothetical protein